MSEENPTPFAEYPCSLGTVVGHEAGYYHIRLPDGRVTGLLAHGEPSPEAIEADIANPAVPPAPVPVEVPAWRIHAVADLAGLTSSIEAIIDALPEPQRTVSRRAWNGNYIARQSATVIALLAALSLTSDQGDDLFRQAAALQV